MCVMSSSSLVTNNAVQMLGEQFYRDALQQCVSMIDEGDERQTGKLDVTSFETVGELGHGSYSTVTRDAHTESLFIFLVFVVFTFALQCTSGLP